MEIKWLATDNRLQMAHPGILAILVGVAIGTALYYYLNSESEQRYSFDFNQSNSSNSNEDDYNWDPNRSRSQYVLYKMSVDANMRHIRRVVDLKCV